MLNGRSNGIWNLVVWRMDETCVDEWQQMGYCVRLPVKGLTNHAIWADNIYVTARAAEHALVISQDFTIYSYFYLNF